MHQQQLRLQLQLQQQQNSRTEHCWEAASSSKYSYPVEAARLDEGSVGLVSGLVGEGGRSSSSDRSRGRGPSGAPTPVKSLELRPQSRLGPVDTVDDFITNESGNSLLLCVFSILLVFPGSACLLVIGGAFTLDHRLQERHQWVRPCAIVMLALGVVLLVTACFIFASICRSYRRARLRRLCAVPPPRTATASGGGGGGGGGNGGNGGSPFTCIVQL